MVSILRKKPVIINMVLIFDIIGTIYCLIKSFVLPQYSFWILPMVYSIFLLFAQINRKMTSSNVGALILNITMSIRYVGVPVIYYSTGILSRFAKDYSNLDYAVWLLLYEMIVVMIVLEVSGRRYYKKEQLINKNNVLYLHVKYGTIIFLLVFAIVLFLAVSYKDLVAGFLVIISGSLEQSVNSVNNNILDIIWETLSTWLYVYIIMKESEKFEMDNSSVHVFKVILYTYIFVLITFIQSVAFSRWYTIISAAAAITCLLKLFPVYKKKIVVSIIIPVIMLIVLITAYKNAGFSIGETKFLDSFSEIFSSSNFDSYFAGPVNVNNAIGVKKNYQTLGIGTFIKDMLHNMPIVNHYMDMTQTSVYSYNAYIGRLWGGAGDQIMPLVGQSSVYFGYLFAPLLSSISVLFVRKFDFLLKKTSSYMMYLYAFTAVWFSVEAMMLNFTININWFYIRIIPFSIAFFVTNKISKKQYQRKKNECSSVE